MFSDLLKKSLLLTLLAITISGCTWFDRTQDLEVRTVEVRVPLHHPTPPRPVRLLDVTWHVLTPENALEKVENNRDGVLYGISVQDYENMSRNMQILREAINERNFLIEYYRSQD